MKAEEVLDRIEKGQTSEHIRVLLAAEKEAERKERRARDREALRKYVNDHVFLGGYIAECLRTLTVEEVSETILSVVTAYAVGKGLKLEE